MGAQTGGYRCDVAEIRSATPDDLQGVFELLDARSRAAFGRSEQRVEYLQQRWALPGFDLAADARVAVVDGAITGYAALGEDQDLELAARDPAVGDALLAELEARARTRGFDHIATTAVESDVPLSELVLRSRFELHHEILRMWRALDGGLPEPRWADGVTVRGYEDADAERVHALLDESYAGWDDAYVARPHAGWLSFMTEHDEFDPEMWFLAERDGELVACALHWGAFERKGWVKDIVVRESERGRGLGTALLQHGFREYAARGAERVGLKVDSTNPTGALQLYAGVGFETDQRYGTWIKRL
jgi:mycothiol synthase